LQANQILQCIIQIRAIRRHNIISGLEKSFFEDVFAVAYLGSFTYADPVTLQIREEM
jgi:hypothetical protein